VDAGRQALELRAARGGDAPFPTPTSPAAALPPAPPLDWPPRAASLGPGLSARAGCDPLWVPVPDGGRWLPVAAPPARSAAAARRRRFVKDGGAREPGTAILPPAPAAPAGGMDGLVSPRVWCGVSGAGQGDANSDEDAATADEGPGRAEDWVTGAFVEVCMGGVRAGPRRWLSGPDEMDSDWDGRARVEWAVRRVGQAAGCDADILHVHWDAEEARVLVEVWVDGGTAACRRKAAALAAQVGAVVGEG
jgi:hypothetical protein